jgi:uncharacterized protein YlxP (DUF503 family)
VRRRPGQVPGCEGRRRVRGVRGAGGRARLIAALLTLDLHIPASGSLKAKRSSIKPLIAALRKDLNVSVAETGHQDLWQRATLFVAIAAGSEIGARKVAQQVEAIVYREPRVEMIDIDIQIVAPER